MGPQASAGERARRAPARAPPGTRSASRSPARCHQRRGTATSQGDPRAPPAAFVRSAPPDGPAQPGRSRCRGPGRCTLRS
eukprot:6481703-Prymnesium_polylepis.2